MQFETHRRARRLELGDRIINLSGTRFEHPMVVTGLENVNGEKIRIGFRMDLPDGPVHGERTLNKRSFVEVAVSYNSESVEV